MITVVERKLLGRFQNRYGPNRVGPVRPAPAARRRGEADRQGALQARQRRSPLLWRSRRRSSIFTAIATLAIIPFGDVQDWRRVGLYGIDVNIGVLYFFAFGSLAFYGLLLGGWASGSKYSFLGAMRSAAQLISYEVSLGLALIGVIMMAGSLSLSRSSRRRTQVWYIVPQFVGFLIFMIAGFAETNRPRSTCRRPTPSWSPATTPSTAACASARSSWPSTSTCS